MCFIVTNSWLYDICEPLHFISICILHIIPTFFADLKLDIPNT